MIGVEHAGKRRRPALKLLFVAGWNPKSSQIIATGKG